MTVAEFEFIPRFAPTRIRLTDTSSADSAFDRLRDERIEP